MDFEKSIKLGGISESTAENYFKSRGYKYHDVRSIKEYQLNDIDYIVEGLGSVEVKRNLHNAEKGRRGLFFWIELKVGGSEGWYYKSKADYFLFNGDSGFVLIKNSNGFRSIIDNAINNGNHEQDGENRIDVISDYRKSGYIQAHCMRVYLDLFKLRYKKYLY